MTKYSGHSGETVSFPSEIPARRGFTVLYRGKTLLSRIDPVAQGERLAREIPVKERTLYFCPSPIYGYGLSLLIERLQNELQQKNSAILCAEADGYLFEISGKAFKEINGNAGGFQTLALTKATRPEDLCSFVRGIYGERVFRRVEVIHLTGGWQLYPELYDDMAGALRREIAREWGNAMTLIRLGRLYARNLIRNLASLPDSENIKTLDFGSLPVLVLGAGPSLDPLLEKFSALSGGNIGKPAERNFKIICVDTCIPALLDRRIIPDLAVILESQHWNLRDFTGARNQNIDAALDLSALPASTRVLKGKRFFFATPWTELRLLRRLEEEGLLPETFAPLGSVGLSAVALALHVGSGPVFTGGIDFAYTQDSFHARSTPGYKENERSQTRFRGIINPALSAEGSFTAAAKTGVTVRSNPIMRNYRNIFSEEFGGNPRLIDINGPGLPLGIKTVSSEEAFAVLNTRTGADSRPLPQSASPCTQKEKITAFIKREIAALESLKETLSGGKDTGRSEMAGGTSPLEELLDTLDYLWAHFPDCAGTGGRRPSGADLVFLKRVRAEIEPFLKLWNMTLNELEKNI